MRKLLKQPYDFIMGLVFLALGLFLLITDVTNGGDSKVLNLGGTNSMWEKAGVYVNIWAFGLAVLSFVLVARSINYTGKPYDKEVTKVAFNMPVVATSIALIVYALIVPFLHFYFSTVLLIWVFCLVYRLRERHINAKEDKQAFIKSVIFAGIYSVTVVTILQLVFTKLLRVILP